MSDTTGRIRRAALLVAAGVLLSRLLGFLRDVVLAGRLGDTPEADAYAAAFIIPDFLNYLLAGGFLAITFIPILSRHLTDDDAAGAGDTLGAVFRPLAVMIIGLTAAAMVLAPQLTELMFGGSLHSVRIDEITFLTRLVLPAQVFFVLGGLYTAVQYAHGRFLIPTLAPIIYNLGIIVGGVIWATPPMSRTPFLPASPYPSATGFIAGALVGAFLGNFVLQWWGARRTPVRMTWGRLSFIDPRFRHYLVLAIPLMVGQSIVVLDESLGRIFAAQADAGSIFSLNLGRRLNMLPIGIIAQAAGVAAYPFFARLVAEDRLSEMRQTMGRTIRSVIVLSGLATALALALSQPAVSAVFLRGAFDRQGVTVAGAALVAYSLSIPAWGVHQILARGFYAHLQMWTPVLAGTAWTLAAIPLFIVGFDRWGVQGLAFASSLAVTGYALTLAVLWSRRHGADGLEGLRATVVRTGVGTATAAFGGWLVAVWIAGSATPSRTESVLAVAGGGIVAIALYVGVGHLLGSPEIRRLLRSR